MLRGTALAGVLVLGAAGCGADGDGGAAATTAPTVAPALQDFCDAFGAVITGPLADEATDVRDPLVLEGAVDLTRAYLATLVEGAPDDLAVAAEQFAAEYSSGFAVWARYGYDLARVDAEATPEERAVLDAFLAPPQGPGDPDPLEELEQGYFARCAAGVSLPDDVLPGSTTTTSP